MKKSLAITSLTVALIIGCTTPQQTTTFNTIASLEQTTHAAYQGYLALVLKGSVRTNDVPQVSKIYNDFQAGVILAATINQSNTNALAPSNLVDESIALVNLINTVKGAK